MERIRRGRPPTDRVERLELLGDLSWNADVVLEDARDRRGVVLASEHADAGERFEQEDAGSVDVGRSRDGLGRELLRRHVEDLALHLSFARRLEPPFRASDTEVEHAGGPIDADQHVLRRHVAMDEAERTPLLVDRFVRRVKSLERARDDRDDDPRGKPRLLITRCAYETAQRFAADVLHDQQQLVLALENVECLNDVRMLHASRESRLVEEHRGEVGIVGELRVQSLDGDGAREADRPHEAAEVDLRHSSRSDRIEDRIAPNHQGGSRVRTRRFFGRLHDLSAYRETLSSFKD